MKWRVGILLLITLSLLKTDILIVMRDRSSYPDFLKKISSLFKKEKIIIYTSDKLEGINFKPRLIFCTEKKVLDNFPEEFLNIPTILFYIQNPLIEVKTNMTGIWQVPPPSIIFSFLNSIGFSGKKVLTIIPGGKKNTSYLQHAERVSQNFSISLNIIEIKKGIVAEEIKEELKDADLIWIFPNEITTNPAFFRYILRLSLDEKKPILGYSKSIVQQGCLFGIEVEEKSYEKSVDEFLKKIEKGRNPLALPFQYPDEFNYYYNLRMAEVLNLKVDFSRFYGEIKYIRR